MLNLLYNYQKELEDSLKQLEINNIIKEIFSYLESKDKFLSFDIFQYKELFNKANYSTEELNIIDNNIKYIKAFSSSLDNDEINNYLNVIKEKFNKLNILIRNIKNEESLKEEYDKITKLINNLKEKSNYIEDIDLIFRIFERNNLLFKDIKDYLKEIIEHNKNVVSNNKEDQNNLIIDESEKNSLLTNILNIADFSDNEISILTNFYQNDREQFEYKYNYLKQEFKYIFTNLKKYKQLFIILMTLSNINDLNNILSIAKERNLNLKKMLPNIYVSRNNKFVGTNDEYYSLFTGSYEDFISNLNYLPKELDLSKVEPTYYIADSSLIRNNYNIFEKYNIILDIDSIECLTINNLQDKLDKIIESGLYDYFKNNPRKILEIKDDLFFYRIKYAKDTGEVYKRKHLVKDLFEPDGYKINENNYQEIMNLYKIPLFSSEEFSNYKNIEVTRFIEPRLLYLFDRYYSTVNNYYYQIGNILISKNKVVSLYNKYLNGNNDNSDKSLIIGLFYSIFDGLILNESETMWLIENIVNTLKIELLDVSEEEFMSIVDDMLEKNIVKGGK